MRITVLALVLLLGAGAFAQPVRFSQSVFNLGIVPEDSLPTLTFEGTNTGRKPLAIASVRGTCGCTVPSYSTAPVGPGGTFQVQVQYDTRGRLGAFEKWVTVHWADSTLPSTTLRLRGYVAARAAASTLPDSLKPRLSLGVPAILQAEKSWVGQKGQAKIPIKNIGTGSLILLDVQAPCRCTSYSINKTPLAPGQEGEITFFFWPSTKGEFSQELYLLSNDPDAPVQWFTLRSTVVDH